MTMFQENHVFTEGERALVTHMVPLGTGVWIACRFSSVLTLLDSTSMQPLQQVQTRRQGKFSGFFIIVTETR